MWDERSSPGELIHPGDLGSIASITSSAGELDFATAVMAIREEAPENPGGAIHSIGTMARHYRRTRVRVSQFSANTLGD
jgi:hypothetical protein